MEVTEYHEIITDEKEKTALKNIKNTLATIIEEKDKSLITPSLLTNDDLLIHFLRARKLDIQKTKIMILKYLHWLKDTNVEDIYLNFKIPNMEELKLYYLHAYHKTSKEGCPIFIQFIGEIDVEKLFELISSSDLSKYSTKLYSTMERELFPSCSKAFNKYIHGLVSIIDFNKMTKNMFNKKLRNLVENDLSICQNYFPECLNKAVVINAGILFKTAYALCKPFIDSKTRSKVHIFNDDYKKFLLTIIDEENLPTFLGGKCTCDNFVYGCLGSDIGPWKKAENETVSEEIRKKRWDVMVKKFGEDVMKGIKSQKKVNLLPP